jgi:hypothetical protein
MIVDVSLKKGSGATDAWVVIDNTDVPTSAGKGRCEIKPSIKKHTFVIWLEGPAGATCDWEFKLDTRSLAKGKMSVSSGNDAQVFPGTFDHA